MITRRYLASMALLVAIGTGDALAQEQTPGPTALPSQAFDLSQVRLLDGPFRQAQERDAAYLLRVDPDRLLARFREYAGLSPKAEHYAGWEDRTISGHSLGHYLSACSQMAAATGDQRFNERVGHIVQELQACQDAQGDGLLYGFPNGRAALEALGRGEIQTQPFDLNGIWVPFYTTHKLMAGLRDAYHLCGNPEALQVESRLADWFDRLLSGLDDEQMQHILRCEHGGMVEVLADLWADTGDKRYEKLARRFRHDAVHGPLAGSLDRLSGLHGNTQIPKLIGHARLYQLAGLPADGTASRFFWDRVVEHHSYANGGHGLGEHFGPPDELTDRLSETTAETCNTYNMIKLTGLLQQVDPQARYADYAERALLNHILASQDPDSGGVTYFMPLASGTTKTYSSPFDNWTCCHGTGMENHALYGASIYGHGDDTLSVHQFIASRLNWTSRGVEVVQETAYPTTGRTQLTFTCKEPVSLGVRVRIPGWAGHDVALAVNGQPVAGSWEPGSYAEIRRTWSTGDKVEVTIPLALRTEAMPDRANRVAIFHGPVLLAGDLGAAADPGSAWPGATPVLQTAGRPMGDWIKPLAGEPGSFRTVGVGWPSDVTLRPFYQTHHVRHAVYWDLTDTPVTLSLDPSQRLNRIDERIYGHFLEHIYHSVNGGLWGDLVWNRSFEQWAGHGRWSNEGDELTQSALAEDVRLVFGEDGWDDYELRLEARKRNGAEGFLILFRATDPRNFYWANLGGWGNVRHAIEKSETGGRQHQVSEAKPGRIEEGRWYPIRVRCEGPHVQVFLDEELVLDYTDRDAPHLKGKVGLGTWGTRAAFRNVEVRALDGRTLYRGTPQAEESSGPPKHWSLTGAGSARPTDREPLNSALAARLEAKDAGASLVQGPIELKAGQRYEGSLWARGEAAAGMRVRLRDGDAVLAEVTLDPPGPGWREYPIALAPASDAREGQLEIGLVGSGSIDLDQVSLMADESRATGGFRPDLLEAMRGLQAPIIRWPGGCFASAYRWKDGIGPQAKRGIYPREIWDDQDVNSMGTDEFLRLCRELKTEPLIVINAGTPNWNPDAGDHDFLQDTLDWIAYCNAPADTQWGARRAANGHPEPYGVTYWEIDNETWHLGPEAYAEVVKRFAPAMRAADPSIKLLMCGSGGLGSGGDGQAWNRVLIEQCADLVDYISIHHYENPNRFAEGPGAFEAFIRDTGSLIATSRNQNLKVYVSEWNAQSTDWRTGLYAGGLLNAFERTGETTAIAGPALFLRHVSATAWDNAFINFDHRGWFPAPNYVVMSLWRKHAAPVRIALSGVPEGLNSSASMTDDGKSIIVKLVNPSGEPMPIELACPTGFAAGEVHFELVAPGRLDARNTLQSPHAVQSREAPVDVRESAVRFLLPAYSAGCLTLAHDRSLGN